jgi:hypothetical protein
MTDSYGPSDNIRVTGSQTLVPLLWASDKHFGHCYGHQTNTWATVMGFSQTLGSLLLASDKHLCHCNGHQTNIWATVMGIRQALWPLLWPSNTWATVMGIRQTFGPLLWASDKHVGHCYGHQTKHVGHCYVPSVRSSCYSAVGLLDYYSFLLLIIFVFFNTPKDPF